MRMKLYQVRVERPNGPARGYIVAPSEERAAKLVTDYDLEIGLPSLAFTLERVDETLPDDRRAGLDGLLEGAPVGFASWRRSIGWISHVATVQKLRLFRIEEDCGDELFFIAPDRETAVTIYCIEYRIGDGEQKKFRVTDGLIGLLSGQTRNLSRLLEFGPVGEIFLHPEHGWLSF